MLATSPGNLAIGADLRGWPTKCDADVVTKKSQRTSGAADQRNGATRGPFQHDPKLPTHRTASSRHHRAKLNPRSLPDPSTADDARLLLSRYVFPEFGQRPSALAKYPGPLRVGTEASRLNCIG
jgi:hypothetical protein